MQEEVATEVDRLKAELLTELQGLPEVLHSEAPELLPDFLATVFKEGDEQEAARPAATQHAAAPASGSRKWDLLAGFMADNAAGMDIASMDAAAQRLSSDIHQMEQTTLPGMPPVSSQNGSATDSRNISSGLGMYPQLVRCSLCRCTLMAPAFQAHFTLCSKRAAAEAAKALHAPAFRPASCPQSKSGTASEGVGRGRGVKRLLPGSGPKPGRGRVGRPPKAAPAETTSTAITPQPPSKRPKTAPAGSLSAAPQAPPNSLQMPPSAAAMRDVCAYEEPDLLLQRSWQSRCCKRSRQRPRRKRHSITLPWTAACPSLPNFAQPHTMLSAANFAARPSTAMQPALMLQPPGLGPSPPFQPQVAGQLQIRPQLLGVQPQAQMRAPVHSVFLQPAAIQPAAQHARPAPGYPAGYTAAFSAGHPAARPVASYALPYPATQPILQQLRPALSYSHPMMGTVTNAQLQQQKQQQQQANGIKAPAGSQAAFKAGSAAAPAWPLKGYAQMQQCGLPAPHSQASGSALTYAQLQSIMAGRGTALARPALQSSLPAGMIPVSNAQSAASAAVYAQPRPAYMQHSAQQVRPAQPRQLYMQSISPAAQQPGLQTQLGGVTRPQAQQPLGGLTKPHAQQPQPTAQVQQWASLQAPQYGQQQAQGMAHMPGSPSMQPRPTSTLSQSQAVRPPAQLYAVSRNAAHQQTAMPGLDARLSNLIYPPAAVQRPAFPNVFNSQQVMQPGQALTAKAYASLPAKAVHVPLSNSGSLPSVQHQQPVIHGISS